MQKQYLFYDLEISGTNPVFDQVYQFGAILADDKFNEIERHEIDIKQLPDVVITPETMCEKCYENSKIPTRLEIEKKLN